jgi:hypothetical protein
MDTRIRETALSLTVVDGESLLSPALAARLIAAVLEASQSQREDEDRRRRDTRIDADGGCGGAA